ncbi:MAG: nitronate monooxygenase [Solirubrobacteraceae bacterium]
MFELAELTEPIVGAPMAGGPSTPQLAIAVCEAGGLGFLAAGYRSTEAVREQIAAVRAATARPFGVNVFVPTSPPSAGERLRDYLRELEPEAERQGVELGAPRHDDDQYERKLELVCEQRVAVASFTFGCPSAEDVTRLHAAAVSAWVTVTAVQEAEQARAAGADALVVQGIEAGGHRATFDDDDRNQGLGLLALLALVRHAVALPLIATGAIGDGAAVAAVLCAGAAAAQIGTALMLAPEAGTAPAHRALLAQPIPTRLTRAFTGRLARGLVNRFLLEHSATAPAAYPEVHHATSGLRAAARKRNDGDAFNLWAGQAHELAQARPAAETVRQLGHDARRRIRELSAASTRAADGGGG